MDLRQLEARPVDALGAARAVLPFLVTGQSQPQLLCLM